MQGSSDLVRDLSWTWKETAQAVTPATARVASAPGLDGVFRVLVRRVRLQESITEPLGIDGGSVFFVCFVSLHLPEGSWCSATCHDFFVG